MKNLDNVCIKFNQVNESLMYALETALVDEWETEEAAERSIKRARDLFYIVWDSLNQIENDLDELNGHIKVCNAVYAVNRVNEMKEELEALKSGEGQSK